MPGAKLKKHMSKPIDPKVLDEEYQQILAEVENEYNDLLLS